MEQQGFNSMKNKGLLWELMSNESKEFRSETSTNLKELQTLFEKCINETINSKNKSLSLLDLNKVFITNLTQKLKIKQPYLSKDIKTSRIEKMNNQLQEKKNEMDSFLTTKKPDEIDFSSSNDSPLTNVDDILKKLEERNYDLASISNESKETAEKAKSWIGLEDSQVKTKEDIKLENEIISNTPINNQSFQSTENSLFSKLKTEETFLKEQYDESNHVPDIHHLLNLILANQKKIMEKLNI